MNLVELTQYTNDEESAEGYLRAQGILKTYEECPHCGSKRINRVRRFKYKCYSCNREWGVRRGSILEGLRIPFTKFLMAIKLFELDASVRESAKQLGLAYNTGISQRGVRSFSSSITIQAREEAPKRFYPISIGHGMVERDAEQIVICPDHLYPAHRTLQGIER